MSANWINDNLASFADDTVRVELGPQIIELDCTDENLCDEVTHPQYKIGGIDALGKVIRPDDMTDDQAAKYGARVADFANAFGVVGNGEKMHCADWRAKVAPHVWKVYQWTETDEIDKKTGKKISRFIQVNEFEDKDEALSCATGLTGGAN